MDPATLVGMLGLGVLVACVYLELNGGDAGGWSIVAFFLLVGSCSMAEDNWKAEHPAPIEQGTVKNDIQ